MEIEIEKSMNKNRNRNRNRNTVVTKLKRNNLRLRSFCEIELCRYEEDDNHSALYWLPL